MNDERIQTLEQVKQFVEGAEKVGFRGIVAREKYEWIEEVLRRFRYVKLKRAGKGLIRRYIGKVTGYSRAQVCRLTTRFQNTGKVIFKDYKRHCFPRKYSEVDIALLATTDELHGWLSGPATKKILEREYQVYGRNEYANLCGISVAQIYNLRRSKRYGARRYIPTRPVVSAIGERARPQPQGQPGHIRIDTVHQGDRDGHKGVYHINSVDEVTQWEVVVSVARITENHLAQALGEILDQFPFSLQGFHSDNGSEFVNGTVATILNKLLIRFTRSRPRHPNDNGLVETKNGSVVRKNLGYTHLPQSCAPYLNRYHKLYLVPYINFHRPCFFAVEEVDPKGKIKKRYLYTNIQTPYEKLKSLPQVESYLRPGVTLERMETYSKQMSDNQFAERMVKARSDLLKQAQRLILFDRDQPHPGSLFD
jgi:transposase InsO family protein